jgi:serine/threonine-protein kinase
VHVAIEALAGLHHAHELVDIDGAPLGVVHRDVTPQNLFLTFDGQVKLLDFGVAKAVDRDQVTHCGELKGCIPYMSPEHARGGPVDRRADLFAVGVVMREALTGERLWARIGDCAILQRLFARDLPPFDDEQIPASLRAVCARAMAPDPDERFATAEEMRAALEAVASTLGGERSLARIGSLVTEHFASERERVRDVLRSHGRTGVSRTDARNAGEDIDTGDATRIERSGISGAVISQCSLPPAAGRSRKWAVRGVVALVAIAGAGAFLGTQRLRAPGVSVASGGSGGAAPQSTLPETRPDTSDAELVDVVIRATPREATIVVDDVVVAHGTWSVRRTRGSDVHRVRVRAPGYAEAGEEFDYGRSSTLNLQLAPTTRAPTPNRGARPAAAASPSAAPAVAIANRPLLPPRDSARASQSLDRQNPYTE